MLILVFMPCLLLGGFSESSFHKDVAGYINPALLEAFAAQYSGVWELRLLAGACCRRESGQNR